MFGLHIFDLHIFAMLSNICKTCFGHRLGLLLILGRHVLYTRSRRLWYGGWKRQTQWKTPYRANLRRRRCVASQVAHSRSGTFSWGPCGCAQVVGDWVSFANKFKLKRKEKAKPPLTPRWLTNAASSSETELQAHTSARIRYLAFPKRVNISRVCRQTSVLLNTTSR